MQDSDPQNPFYNELVKFYSKVKDKLPIEVQSVATSELKRLQRLAENTHDLGPTINYLQLLFALPWQKQQSKKISIKTARGILNASHFGMEKVKDKCIEYIAAQNSSGQLGGVLCFDGPPGVGKTSIAHSVAKAMGRTAIKISISGVDDTAIIRGFHRTYSGSQPGAIIKQIRRAGVSNPVIILDEGDKPGSESIKNALLEVLDPEQNKGFKDHYLGLEYDLSDVLFIITTNNIDQLPSPLVERMDVIRLNAHTDEEKFLIARHHLAPKQLSMCGLTERQLRISDDALSSLINDYVAEAGVRELERKIQSICRKKNVIFQMGVAKSATVSAKTLSDVIGPSRIYKTYIPSEDTVGLTTGLYTSDMGGGMIPVQVSLRVSDKFNIAVTGLPGRMLKESSQYASEMLHFLAHRYGIDLQTLYKTNIHVHLVDGGSEKDGPSAGTAMATAIISALKGIKTNRYVAMTGEVDLYGNVLPIGGVVNKLEGARKSGAKIVLIPWANQPDLYDVPNSLKTQLQIIPVKHMDEVLDYALVEKLPEPISLTSSNLMLNTTPTPDEISRVFQYVVQQGTQTTPIRYHGAIYTPKQSLDGPG